MNKKTIQLFAALATGACFAASAAGQEIIAVWNFNDVSNAPASQFAPSFGAGTLSTNWASANLGEFGGSNINLFGDDGAGRDIAFQNGGSTGSPANEGNSLTFAITIGNPLEGNEFISLSYAGRTTGTGMRDLTWSYSTDGSLFTDFLTVDHVASFGAATYGLVTLDFRSIGFTSGAFFIRGTFATQDGQSSPTSVGSTRFDNVQIEVIPEPSTYAAIVGALFLGLVLYRRRTR